MNGVNFVTGIAVIGIALAMSIVATKMVCAVFVWSTEGDDKY